MSIIDAVTIRPMLPAEVERVADLLTIGFGGEKSQRLAMLQGNPRFDSSHLIVAEYAGAIVGTATVFPAQMWLSGVPVKVGAVAGVTVQPEQRQQGIAARLMEVAIERMFAAGLAMSILFPFSPKYYNKFGYGVIGEVHTYRLNPANLTVFEEGHQVRPFEAIDLPMMRVMYKGQMTWHNGWFTRSNGWWDELIRRWPQMMVFENDGMIEGYYAYDLETSDQGQRVLRVREFFAAENQAYRGLMSYLAAQTEADVIEYYAPPDTPLRHMLRQPVADQAQNRGWIFNDLCYVAAGPMGRVINLREALTTRFYKRGLSGERVLRVADPLIPSNEQPIVFRIVDGRAETRPSDSATPQIETDIKTISQILAGYLSAKDAHLLGRFETDEDTCSWLDQALADSPLFIQPGDWF